MCLLRSFYLSDTGASDVPVARVVYGTVGRLYGAKLTSADTEQSTTIVPAYYVFAINSGVQMRRARTA